MPNHIRLQVELPDAEAWAFAQFLKRVYFEHYRALSVSEEEADVMLAAGEAIRRALAEQGYAPR
jgi:hypothetical protein